MRCTCRPALQSAGDRWRYGKNMEYDENQIEKMYQENLSAARQALALLPVAEGREPTTKGLNGWVYEQTVRPLKLRQLSMKRRIHTIVGGIICLN